MRRLLVLCALLAAPSLLLAPALGPGQALLPADLLVQFEPWRSHVGNPPLAFWDALLWDGVAQYYPWRLFAAESLRTGHIPLWNPYQFCGTPFLANGQSAVLYPLGLLFLALPVARGFAVSAWLHLVLTGWFGYLFLRRIGLRPVGALCGALAWQTSSFFVAWLHLPTVLCTAAWLPLVLLFCERSLTSGQARYALAAGGALTLSYLGGHPQIFLFVSLLTAAYLIASVGRAFRRPPAVRLVALLKTGTITAVFALALSAAQLLPTLDLLRITHRTFIPGPESYRAFLSRALPTPLLANLLLPHPLGHPALGTYLGPENYAEYCCYIGIVALALALWGAFAWRTWHARLFAVTALLAVLVAVGTPLNWPLYHWLPGMSGAGGPARIILLAVFSLAMLAGAGADALSPRAPGRAGPLAGPVIAFALVGAIAAVWWQTAGAGIGRAAPAVGSALSGEMVRAALLLVGAVVMVASIRRAALRQVAQAGLLVIIAADLLLAAQRHGHIVPQSWVYSAEADPGPISGRVLGNAADWPLSGFPRAVLPPNAATVYHLRDAFGYDSLYLAQYRDFASLIQGGDPSPPSNGNLLLARLGPSYGWDALSLAGVDTVLSLIPVRGLQLERAAAFDRYRNPYARSRAWITESAVFVESRQEAVRAMVRLGALEDCLIVTGPYQSAEKLPPGPRPTARVRDLSPNELVVELPQGGGGYLFLADSHAPGWRAYAGDHELPIRIAGVAFRAVAPPRETRSVLFRYEPASFRVGLFITLTTLTTVTLAASLAGMAGRMRR